MERLATKALTKTVRKGGGKRKKRKKGEEGARKWDADHKTSQQNMPEPMSWGKSRMVPGEFKNPKKKARWGEKALAKLKKGRSGQEDGRDLQCAGIVLDCHGVHLFCRGSSAKKRENGPLEGKRRRKKEGRKSSREKKIEPLRKSAPDMDVLHFTTQTLLLRPGERTYTEESVLTGTVRKKTLGKKREAWEEDRAYRGTVVKRQLVFLSRVPGTGRSGNRHEKRRKKGMGWSKNKGA